MADWFIGEIRLFSFQIVPAGWLACQGQLLDIVKYKGLFQYIGNRYGGDGRVNFNLPDLRGRVLVGEGPNPVSGWNPGSSGTYGGLEQVTLTSEMMPAHQHAIQVKSIAGDKRFSTQWCVLGGMPKSTGLLYGTKGAPVPLNEQTIAPAGAAAPRPNMQPFLALQYCIATGGMPPPKP